MTDRLLFDDIDEWTPSSISIVDEPFHPCCHFEVYEDDEEYVKKSIQIDGEIMSDTQNTEPKVEVSEGFLERLLGRSIMKSDDEVEKEDEAPSYEELAAKIDALEARIAKLEEANAKEAEEKPAEPVKDAVQKSEGETGEASETSEAEETTEETEEEDEVVDAEEVVTKSIDPDLVITDSTEKTLNERTGRKSNGMTW